jgi:putative sigma-54 modulation protein
MRIEYVQRGYHATDKLKAFAEEKLAKAVKFLEEPLEAKVTLEMERHLERAHVQVLHRHGALQAAEETAEMRDAILQAVEKIEGQAKRARKRFMDRRRRAARSAQNGEHWPVDVVEKASLGTGSSPRIIKSSLLRIKPMSIEDAALHLESSEHAFVVFRDEANDRVSVLYRRKDEHYGLIAPEF